MSHRFTHLHFTTHVFVPFENRVNEFLIEEYDAKQTKDTKDGGGKKKTKAEKDTKETKATEDAQDMEDVTETVVRLSSLVPYSYGYS